MCTVPLGTVHITTLSVRSTCVLCLSAQYTYVYCASRHSTHNNPVGSLDLCTVPRGICESYMCICESCRVVPRGSTHKSSEPCYVYCVERHSTHNKRIHRHIHMCIYTYVCICPRHESYLCVSSYTYTYVCDIYICVSWTYTDIHICMLTTRKSIWGGND